MEYTDLTPDTTFPFRLFRFAHKRALDAVSTSYFAVLSKDHQPVGLILVVDIAERWHHAREAATTFWQIFVREFNHSESRSSLTRFEEALRELNRAVVKTEEKVQQPISVAVAILEGSQIHFSTIGTSRVLLISDGKFSDVTAGSEKSGNQFAAVTSGDIDSGDVICAANQNLYEFLAAEPDDLWSVGSAEALSQEILGRAQNSEAALNCILLQYDPDHPTQTTLYWEESEKRYPIALPKFSLPSLRAPSWPKLTFPKVKLGKISWPKLTFLKPFLARVVSLVGKLSWRTRGIILVAGLVIIGAIWLATGRNSQPTAAPEIGIVEEFRTTPAADSITYLTNLALSPQLADLSDEELAEITAIAAERGVQVLRPDGHLNELPEPIVAIAPTDNSLFVVSQSGQLWQIDPTGTLKQIDHQFKVINPKSVVAFSESALVVTDAPGNIWYYDGQSNGPTAIALPPALATGEKLIAKFGSNLYIYSSSQNAVYRQTNFSGQVTANTPYANLSAIDNAKLLSWAINGNFIGLTEQKNLVAWRLNKAITAPVTLPHADSSSRLASTEESLIIAQTAQLVSGYSAASELLWQKFYLSAEPVGDVAIVGNQLWLAIGQKIYRASL